MTRFLRLSVPLSIFLAGALLLAGLIIAASGHWARDQALRSASHQAQGAAQLNTLALRTHLEKFRAIPRVLAGDPEVRQALHARAGTRAAIDIINQKLEQLSRDIDASAIYLLRTDGLAIAASNWQDALSFVGQDYRFRPYFQWAMETGHAEYFALGTRSQEPGLYLSRRIDGDDGTTLGVVVLKMTFDVLERDWSRLPEPIYVTDSHGVVIISNIPGWRFRTVASLSTEDSQALRNSLQFGDASLSPLPLAPSTPINAQAQLTHAVQRLPHIRAGSALLHVSQAVEDTPGMTLHMLSPVGYRIGQAQTNAQLYALLTLSAIGAMVGLGYYHRRRAERRAREQIRRNVELEAQVLQRTRQLDQTNHELMAQMDERQRTEARLHQMQDELIQANKLALLGQVTAGVAHEINQPLAAIRHYADNAVAFLQRENTDAVHGNLQDIARLTDRIGNITDELRTFSRKRSSGIAAIALSDALDGALMLTAPRIKRENVHLHYPPPPSTLLVQADRMRLEQVFVNLLQNALDAMAASAEPAPRLSITVTARHDRIAIFFQDNGPGLPDDARARLFMPFHTTKPEGLGLGLIISRDLLAEFGGTLQAADSQPQTGGACFIVTLQPGATPECKN